MVKVYLPHERCDPINSEFWGRFPDEPGQQEQHSATHSLHRNKGGEWFVVYNGKGARPKNSPSGQTTDMAAIRADLLSPAEASEFLDNRLRLLREALKN